MGAQLGLCFENILSVPLLLKIFRLINFMVPFIPSFLFDFYPMFFCCPALSASGLHVCINNFYVNELKFCVSKIAYCLFKYSSQFGQNYDDFIKIIYTMQCQKTFIVIRGILLLLLIFCLFEMKYI